MNTLPAQLLLTVLAVVMLGPGCATLSHQARARLDELMRVIADPAIDRAAFDKAMAQIDTLPVLEPTEAWGLPAEDSRLESYRRRKCVFALLRRHVPDGTRLARFGEMLFGSTWLAEENFTENNFGGSSVFHADQCSYLFGLPFMREEHSVVEFIIKPYILKSELLGTLEQGRLGKRVKIVRIYCLDP